MTATPSNSSSADAGFSAMGHAYRANARVDVKSPTFLARLEGWRPARSLLWQGIRGALPPALGLMRGRCRVDGHRIHFVHGGGRRDAPVLFLHGFGSIKENWLQMRPLIGGYRMIAPDLPGFGESHFHADQSYDFVSQARRVAAFIESVARGPVHLVGNSMGGAIAAYVASTRPDLVRSLVLMNAAGVPGSEQSAFERTVMSGKNTLVPKTLAHTRRLAEFVVARGAVMSWAVAPVLHAEMRHRYHVNHRIFSDILDVPEDPRHVFARISVPTLVLWGDSDRVLSASSAHVMASIIPGAKCRVLRGVGHLPMIEAPLKTTRAMKRLWRHADSLRGDPLNPSKTTLPTEA